MTDNAILKLGDAAARKALTDVEFRKRLVADGNKAIEEEYGKEFPVKVSFHDFTDKKLTFVLPAKTTQGELGDDALSAVTGGRGRSGGVGMGSCFVKQVPIVPAYGVFPSRIDRK